MFWDSCQISSKDRAPQLIASISIPNYDTANQHSETKSVLIIMVRATETEKENRIIGYTLRKVYKNATDKVTNAFSSSAKSIVFKMAPKSTLYNDSDSKHNC